MNYRHVGTVVRAERLGPDPVSQLRGIAVDRRDQLHVVADASILALVPDGAMAWRLETDREPQCVAVADDGTICVGELSQIEIFDPQRRLKAKWGDRDRLQFPSAIAISATAVYVADVNRRSILRYDHCGKFLNEIGKDNSTDGFLIPNGRLDFDLDIQEVIHAANPGKHRIERYAADGKLLGRFGRFDGRDPAGFSGCCNPTGVALLRGGGWAVTEKAPPRVKVYDADGGLKAHWGVEVFDPLAKNMDIATDSRGRIFVLDPVRMRVEAFEPEQPAGDAGPPRETQRRGDALSQPSPPQTRESAPSVGGKSPNGSTKP